MSTPAIRVERLGKRYRIGRRERYHSLRDTLAGTVSAPFRRHRPAAGGHIWALRDLSFSLEQGEVLGVIGLNGAGKSTLLKILSRITEPTEGDFEVRGRLGSLLEVGTGFHPELTGRENIHLNGAILGMTRAEIERKFDAIVAFAEVEQFLDTPVKFYSSGMYLRLGFAVASHLDPEILLVDEVLAVGDVAFQRKCLGTMGAAARGGRTVLFVSHNMTSIARLCTKALLLSAGTGAYLGAVGPAIGRYLAAGAGEAQSHVDLRGAPRWSESRREIATSISTHRLDGTETVEFATGEGMLIRIGYRVDEPIVAYCQLNFYSPLGERVMTLRSTHAGEPWKLSGEGVIACGLEDLRLISGEYIVMLDLGREFPHREPLDCVLEATRVRVSLGDYLGGAELGPGHGVLAQRARWTIES